MASPRIRADVAPRKEWAISPKGDLCRVSMAPNVGGPLQYAVDENGYQDLDRPMCMPVAFAQGWAALVDVLAPEVYSEFQTFQVLADKWARKRKPANFPEVDPYFLIPAHLVPDVCRERMGMQVEAAAEDMAIQEAEAKHAGKPLPAKRNKGKGGKADS